MKTGQKTSIESLAVAIDILILRGAETNQDMSEAITALTQAIMLICNEQ